MNLSSIANNNVYSKKKKGRLYSKNHLLADDISKYLSEPKKFAMYLGIIKNIGYDAAYQIFSEIKQLKKAKNKAKLFMWKVKQINKIKNAK